MDITQKIYPILVIKMKISKLIRILSEIIVIMIDEI